MDRPADPRRTSRHVGTYRRPHRRHPPDGRPWPHHHHLVPPQRSGLSSSASCCGSPAWAADPEARPAALLAVRSATRRGRSSGRSDRPPERIWRAGIPTTARAWPSIADPAIPSETEQPSDHPQQSPPPPFPVKHSGPQPPTRCAPWSASHTWLPPTAVAGLRGTPFLLLPPGRRSHGYSSVPCGRLR